MARYQPRPSAAFAQVIEPAGNCITRRLCCCAQGSTNRQARYQRQPSAAFAQGPGTRAQAITEQRHKQRGLKHAAKTSCELHAGQRHLTDDLRQCRPTGRCDVINAASSAQGRQHIAFAEARCTSLNCHLRDTFAHALTLYEPELSFRLAGSDDPKDGEM